MTRNEVYLSSVTGSQGLYVKESSLTRLQVGKFPYTAPTASNMFNPVSVNAVFVSGSSFPRINITSGSNFVNFDFQGSTTSQQIAYSEFNLGTIGENDTFSLSFDEVNSTYYTAVSPSSGFLQMTASVSSNGTPINHLLVTRALSSQYPFTYRHVITYQNTGSTLSNVRVRFTVTRPSGASTSPSPVLRYDNIIAESVTAKVNITNDQVLFYASPQNYLEWRKDSLTIKTGLLETTNLSTGDLIVRGNTLFYGSVTVFGDLASHPIISPVATSVNNSNGNVIQDLGFDQFGHVTSSVTYDLDNRYYTETEADTRFYSVNGGYVSGSMNISGSVTINGGLTVLGDFISASVQTVIVEDNLMLINHGDPGPGVTAGIAGIAVERGSWPDYWFVFRESDESFTVGESGSLQAVATREDAPISGGVMYYNPSTFRMETDASFHKRGTIVTTPGVVILGTAGTSTTHAVRADRTISTGNGIVGGGNLTADRTLALGGMARAVHDNATNGFFTRIASASVASRTMTGTNNQVNITNGDGVSGNPTFSLPQDISTTSSVQFNLVTLGTQASTTAHAVRADRTITFASSSQYILWSTTSQNLTADRTWTIGIISASVNGTSNQITVTGNGRILGTDLTLSLPQNIHLSASVRFDTINVGSNAVISGSLTVVNTLSASAVSLTQLTVDNIRLDGNTISTLANNLIVSPSGTHIELNGSLIVSGSTNNTPLTIISPGITGTGVIVSIRNGSSIPRFTINGAGRTEVSGSISLTGSFDAYGAISGSTLQAGELNINNIRVLGNTILSTNTNGNINLVPNGAGKIYVSGSNEMMLFEGTSALGNSDAWIRIGNGGFD